MMNVPWYVGFVLKKLIPEFLLRKWDEPGISLGRLVLWSALVPVLVLPVAQRPPQPITRRDCRAWAEPEPVQGPDSFSSPPAHLDNPCLRPTPIRGSRRPISRWRAKGRDLGASGF